MLGPLLAAALLSYAGVDDPRPEERGLPALRSYASADLGTSQLFSLTIASGRLYVGGLSRLATYDGARWRSASGYRALYAVATDERHVVAGGPDLLLAWDINRTDAPPTELHDLLPEADRAFGDVRSIHRAPVGFLVVTDRRLLRVRDSKVETMHRFEPDPRRRGFWSLGQLIIVDSSGATRFDASGQAMGAFELPPEAKGVVSVLVDLPRNPGSQLVAIEGHGLFLKSGATWKSVGGGAPVLSTVGFTDARVLRSGAVALGTQQVGLVLLTPDLVFDRLLGREDGLPTGQVVSLAEDDEGGLWVAGESELTRLDFGAALSVIDARMGLDGTTVGFRRPGKKAYALTTAGLFALESRRGASMRARRVPSLPARVWDAMKASAGGEGTLLIATASGVFAMDPETENARLVPGTGRISAYRLHQDPEDPDRIFVGSRGGLSILRRAPSGWRFERDVPEAPRYVRTMVSRPGGWLYIGSVFDGAQRLRFVGEKVERQALGGNETMLMSEGGRLFALQAEPPELNVVDEKTGALKPFISSKTLPIDPLDMLIDPRGAMWVSGGGVFIYDIDGRGPGDGARVVSGRQVLDRSRVVQHMDVEADGVVWMSGADGLWRWVLTLDSSASAPTLPSIENVTVSGESSGRPSMTAPLSLAYGFERLRIEMTPNTFRPDASIAFRLDPLDSDWSADRVGAVAEYTSLPEGDYRFRMRRVERGVPVGDERTLAIVVRPPWHRAPLVRAAQAVAFLLAIGAAIQFRTRRLRRESRRLEAAIAEKTAALQEANRRLDELARHDELTTLFNRRHFDEALRQEWGRALRLKSPLGVALVDIDHFKALNDAHGHAEGDRALRAVAEVLASHARRPGDIAARHGGEEFALLLPGTTIEGVRAIAEEVRTAVAALTYRAESGETIALTVSVGIAVNDGASGSPADLVAAADAALYRAKAGGRNRVAV